VKKGIVAGGIVLFILPNIINNIQSNNLAECGSLTGQLGQTLDQHQAEICKPPRYQSFASTGLIVGIIMLALGIVLIIIGVLKEGTPKVRRET
jgi:ABC-type amino acid transport system permease subunit